MFQDNGLISGINKDRISNERLVYIKQPNSPCVCLFGWLVVAVVLLLIRAMQMIFMQAAVRKSCLDRPWLVPTVMDPPVSAHLNQNKTFTVIILQMRATIKDRSVPHQTDFNHPAISQMSDRLMITRDQS